MSYFGGISYISTNECLFIYLQLSSNATEGIKKQGIQKYRRKLRRKSIEAEVDVKAEQSFLLVKLCRRNSCPVVGF